MGARALQGVFAALLAPAALSLLATTFTDPHERAKAFGIYGAIAGAGGAVGLLLGGILTEVLDWRWCLYVSILFAVPAAIGGLRAAAPRARSPRRPRLDIPGTIIASVRPVRARLRLVPRRDRRLGRPPDARLPRRRGGAAGRASSRSSAASPTRCCRCASCIDRNRGGAYLAIGIAGAGIFGVFLFLTFYLQNTLGFSPIETGLAFLPMNVAIIVTATTGDHQARSPRTGPRPLIPTGMVLAALGDGAARPASASTPTYASHVLPSLILIGVGFGLVLAPAFATATLGVPRQDAGVASAMVNTSQQVGGSIGTALL